MNNAGNRLLAGVLLAGLATMATAEQEVRFSGSAESLDSGEIVYTEHHRQTGECRDGFWAPREHEVTYRSPEGETIAEKTLDYGDTPSRPSFTLEDQRFGERMQVNNPDDGPVRIRYRASNGDKSSYRIKAPDNGVIDAGFEVMVRQNWETLVEDGDTVRIEFLVPTRGEFYAFKAEPAEMEPLEGKHVFRISVAGWVSSWFVDPLHLAFNDERQLTDFHGLTNILKNPEDNHRAHIRYDHESAPGCR
ncbi:hypothetical protein [Vreelandella utahensis]|uniref:hypothetical protein n=1 Tax=Vreelandella halophila TaxID=86177 RepID=UPI0009849409|nr:hypothetical protein [Halomonas utahensis]